MRKVEEILRFWFGESATSEALPEKRRRLWFGGSETTDRRIRERFGADVRRAARGEYDHWPRTARGALGLILLLDQFTRNIYRDTPAAYAQDAKSREVCLAGLEKGQDRLLGVAERAFFYLPLEHAENRRLQMRSVQAFAALRNEAPPQMKAMSESFYDYALRHQAVIERFGRFPHRNAVLSRPSTAEEEAFLQQPGSSF
jgi:uncharacterized protein (DUF924 family)